MGRPLASLTLTEDEASELRGWARRPKTAQALALRARIILRCGEGCSNSDVAEEARCHAGDRASGRRGFNELLRRKITSRTVPDRT